jgi:hypothetical protein
MTLGFFDIEVDPGLNQTEQEWVRFHVSALRAGFQVSGAGAGFRCQVSGVRKNSDPET